ncbi:hypothetical protein, partial [Campylobacter troglodytis]|uniref:hypothetical protein n=1 Tax=Campylobacter troglodytis TaxID=654363 RepID=UPI00163CA4FF
QMLAFLENERVIKQWEARSGEALMNLKEDLQEKKKETLQENRQEKQKEKKQEKIFDILVSYDKLDLKGIELNQKDELCSLFKAFDIKEESEISLSIKETKHILILIERFKETTESTLSRMNIYIDGKRVDKNGKFIENSQSLLNQAYHTNKLISLNETSLARLTQRNSQTLSNEDSLNSQEGLKFTQTQEAMKQEGLKFKEAQERIKYEFFNPLLNDELFNPLLADDKNYAYI